MNAEHRREVKQRALAEMSEERRREMAGWPEEKQRALVTFIQLIEEYTGKTVDDPTLTPAEAYGAVGVIEAEGLSTPPKAEAGQHDTLRLLQAR